jgi:hypothetical protein
MHIPDSSLANWDQLDQDREDFFAGASYSYLDLVKLPQFKDWLIGFTMAEGSFGTKIDNSAFYSIRQTGFLNLEFIKAIQYLLLGELRSEIKPDSSDSYKIAMTSKKEIQKVIDFFSFSNIHPLLGYKAENYVKWIKSLKNLKRYSSLNYPNV